MALFEFLGVILGMWTESSDSIRTERGDNLCRLLYSDRCSRQSTTSTVYLEANGAGHNHAC